jgi:hypothetical protein
MMAASGGRGIITKLGKIPDINNDLHPLGGIPLQVVHKVITVECTG